MPRPRLRLRDAGGAGGIRNHQVGFLRDATARSTGALRALLGLGDATAPCIVIAVNHHTPPASSNASSAAGARGESA